MAKCEHKTVELAWDANRMYVVAYQCFRCKALGVRSLGPSNDEPEAVRVEMRAAELDAWYIADDLSVTQEDGWDEFEIDGWRSRCGGGDLVGTGSFVSWMRQIFDSGWLACEMTMHEVRETRDASAWPWDPARPVAGQFEALPYDVRTGTTRHTVPLCPTHGRTNRNADGDCIECTRERTEAAQAEEHEIRRSVTAPGISVAIDQLLEDDEAARRDAKERQTALDAARDRPIGAADVFDDEAFDVSDVLPDSEQR